MTYLIWTLMWFEACSELRVNLNKSDFIAVGNVDESSRLANYLGCKLGKLTSKYLGQPFGLGFKSKLAWDGIE